MKILQTIDFYSYLFQFSETFAMKNIGVLFLLAYHSTFLQGVYLLSKYSNENRNDYELDVIENTDKGRHEMEINYKLAGLRSESKDQGRNIPEYIKL